MSIFHCSIKIISRSVGRSAISASAYRSGTKLYDQETGDLSDYSRKQGILHHEVILCENAPSAYADREVLWNAVQKIESQKNAQLAREVEIAIPKEIPTEDRIALVREYVQENFVSQGMCADFALHDKGDGNPHAHILLTTRPILKNGKWGQKEKKDYARDADGNKIPVIDPATGQQKVRVRKGKGTEKLWQRVNVQTNDWNDQGNAEKWRKAWADLCNRHLAPEVRIDHRSYKRQGVERIPTIHEGSAAREMERRGETADRCEINRQIRAANDEQQTISKLLQALYQEMQDLKQRIQSIIEMTNQKGRDLLHERIGNFLQRRNHTAASRPAGADADRDRAADAGARHPAEATQGAGEPTADTFLRELEVQVQAAEDGRQDREAERVRQDLARQQQAASRDKGNEAPSRPARPKGNGRG